VADAGDATRRGPLSAPKDAPVTAGTGASLTPNDYIEIAQLVASYGNALDSGWGTGENGDAYAALYTPDASFVGAVGHDQLAALAVAQPHGPQFIRHFLTNHVIEPTPEGARGKQYLVVLDLPGWALRRHLRQNSRGLAIQDPTAFSGTVWRRFRATGWRQVGGLGTRSSYTFDSVGTARWHLQTASRNAH
jgi:hypothetical protein